RCSQVLALSVQTAKPCRRSRSVLTAIVRGHRAWPAFPRAPGGHVSKATRGKSYLKLYSYVKTQQELLELLGRHAIASTRAMSLTEASQCRPFGALLPVVTTIPASEGVKKLGLWRGSSDPRADGNRKFVRVLAISLTRSSCISGRAAAPKNHGSDSTA